MILIDISQVLIAATMVHLSGRGDHSVDEISLEAMDESLIRHMVLNSIRSNRVKFADKYGDVVIACDGPNTWRKEYFPYYKANRKKTRDETGLNWGELFRSFDVIREELKLFFPYPVVRVTGAEADDVIATLVEANVGDRHMIVSGDKDFQQLQKFPQVEQYNPVQKKFLECTNPDLFLRDHIIRGDQGDGIPNFLSADDVLVTKTRQKSIISKKAAQWVLQDSKEFCDETTSRYYERNRTLIDFDCIPSEVRSNILLEWETQQGKNRDQLFGYFQSRGLKHLLQEIGSF